MTMSGHAIWASRNSEVRIDQDLTINSIGDSPRDAINLEEGSLLHFNDSQSAYTVEKFTAETGSEVRINENAQVTLGHVELRDGSQLRLRGSSPTWSVPLVTCWNQTTTSGQSIARPNVIFFDNGDNSTVSSIDSDCGVVQ